MTAVFVDTWFFIAHLHKYDPGHEAALRLARRYRETLFVTHDGVLVELLSFFAGRGLYWRTSAAELVRDAMRSRKYQVTPLSRDLFGEALTLYEQRADKEYSLVDCTSMHLMKRHDISEVLTNDHHFRQEGFVVVNQ
jgi:predicted nucleic acid-binding protein